MTDMRFGESVSPAGDVDGDGRADWLIADGRAGSAWIVSGADSHALRRLGDPASDRPRRTIVSTLGDVDGDGRPDVLVSAGQGSSEPVRAFNGNDGRILFSVEGEWAVSIGDVNSDGKSDFVVANPDRPSMDAKRAHGRFTVRSGSDGRVLRAAERDCRAGWNECRVFATGDVDGDHTPDWGATALDGIALFSGKDASLIRIFPSFDGMSPTCICGVGDLDGDGMQDLLVGCPDPEWSSAGHGSFRVYSNVFDKVIRSCEHRGGNVGNVLCPLGDVNGDGVPDYIVGFHDEGPYDPIRAYSGKDARQLYEYQADTLDSCHREPTFAAIPDVDGDGAPDLIVGIPSYLGDCNEPGVVAICSGRSGTMLRQITKQSLIETLPAQTMRPRR
jgi:hypothetical protein